MVVLGAAADVVDLGGDVEPGAAEAGGVVHLPGAIVGVVALVLHRLVVFVVEVMADGIFEAVVAERDVDVGGDEGAGRDRVDELVEVVVGDGDEVEAAAVIAELDDELGEVVARVADGMHDLAGDLGDDGIDLDERAFGEDVDDAIDGGFGGVGGEVDDPVGGGVAVVAGLPAHLDPGEGAIGCVVDLEGDVVVGGAAADVVLLDLEADPAVVGVGGGGLVGAVFGVFAVELRGVAVLVVPAVGVEAGEDVGVDLDRGAHGMAPARGGGCVGEGADGWRVEQWQCASGGMRVVGRRGGGGGLRVGSYRSGTVRGGCGRRGVRWASEAGGGGGLGVAMASSGWRCATSERVR
ncbi:MAG: hypothetical protein R3F65_00450 [bacterium]